MSASDILRAAHVRLRDGICIARVATHAMSSAEDSDDGELLAAARGAMEVAIGILDAASNEVDRADGMIARSGARPDPKVVKLMREVAS